MGELVRLLRPPIYGPCWFPRIEGTSGDPRFVELLDDAAEAEAAAEAGAEAEAVAEDVVDFLLAERVSRVEPAADLPPAP